MLLFSCWHNFVFKLFFFYVKGISIIIVINIIITIFILIIIFVIITIIMFLYMLPSICALLSLK